ncbi:glycoside hydrolase family 76 protein [Microbacterium sp. IEGM 1404]|uniref:glycoside hydrolase family 76 protein n=1 Tax=Microbacterium sp. IEGM 1404 TaxID=3047084 RepID=UPI0024B692F6|nr:glycoside hydrolase family 76 protein [Microbacterium sp. IEGM 1404]MDI9892142.1 glycoside hydrolase family 76 protein [Microbacterium sp. IEGM 1404]
MDATPSTQQRAAAAEDAVITAYVHRYGPVAWAHAATAGDGARTWHYWWHAHLVHVLAEAERHRPSAARRRLIGDLLRGVTVRTAGTWITPFFDDIAWMGLALAETRPHGRPRARIARLLAGAFDPAVGALPWRTRSVLYNAPANGPAAMVLAPSRHRALAERMAAWMAAVLDDPATGLVRDGIEHGGVRPDLWTYNQGVAIGAALALGDGTRAGTVLGAVDRWCAAEEGLFPAAGGGDGGLFAGILARYLGVAASRMDGEDADRARRLVRRNADALWAMRRDGAFPADPRRPALPTGDDRDLSVQLGAWITLEADVTASASVTS